VPKNAKQRDARTFRPMSPFVEGFGCRPVMVVPRGLAAGVRKPAMDETATTRAALPSLGVILDRRVFEHQQAHRLVGHRGGAPVLSEVGDPSISGQDASIRYCVDIAPPPIAPNALPRERFSPMARTRPPSISVLLAAFGGNSGPDMLRLDLTETSAVHFAAKRRIALAPKLY
jgi:hypothetical protein